MTKCWDGYEKHGEKRGKNGRMVNNCVKCKHTSHVKGMGKRKK